MTNYSLNVIPDTWKHYEHPWYNQLDLLGNSTTSAFPSQQKHKSEATGVKSTKVCRYCGNEKPFNDFHLNPQYEDGRDHRCKHCCSVHRKQEREALKKAPPAPCSCELCGSERRLQPDHIHGTETFRGWLCKPCNTRIGWLETNHTTIYEYLSTNGSQIEDGTGTSQIFIPC